jgi:hypothetical protein
MGGKRGHMSSRLPRILNHRAPLRALARKAIQAFSLFSYEDRLRICAIERPHYGHCLYEAAKLAARLEYPRISVIEFGCGGGNGLLNAEMHISELERLFPVKFELYGFDSGQGLPPPEDYRDFSHYFKSGNFKMNAQHLRSRLNRAKLIIGNVKETCSSFFAEHKASPIGCIFHDLDLYSSTKDAFTLFEADSSHFLPRVFMYFDDVIGDNTWLVNEFAGELLAIDEFNRDHRLQKIAVNRAMQHMYSDQLWSHQIYAYHDFQHPEYNKFVADKEVREHENAITLR